MKSMQKMETMVWTITLAAALGLGRTVPLANAAVPQEINYQGYLTDDSGNPIDGGVEMLFAIYDQEIDGSELWSEGPMTVPVDDGMYSVILGETVPITPALLDGPCWLEVIVEGEYLVPRERVTSTPFTIEAEEADKVDGYEGAALEESAEIDADISAHAGDADAHHARYTNTEALTACADMEESAEIDADIAAHSAIADIHHAKTTSFAELTDTVVDAQIPDNITIDYAAIAGGVPWSGITSMPVGFSDGVDDVGVTTETDPTVLSSVKDGITWAEIGSRPAGLDDGDDVGITAESDPTVAASVKDGVDFSELTDTATDAQIPNTITINYASSAGNADTLDGYHASTLEESAEIDTDISAHAVSGDHDGRYVNIDGDTMLGDLHVEALTFNPHIPGNRSYAIFQEDGGWSHPYPDLRIAYHSGINIGANSGYGGTVFFNNHDMVTPIFSVGNGDNNTRCHYNLQIDGILTGWGGGTLTVGNLEVDNQLVEGSLGVLNDLSVGGYLYGSGLTDLDVASNLNVGGKLKVNVASGGAAEIGHSANTATGNYAVAMGLDTHASGHYSTTTGVYTTASGYNATAMGRSIIANADYSFAIGLYDSQPKPTINQARTMAIMGGSVGIGTVTPGWTLEVNGSAAKPGGGSWTSSSDIRLKKNVETLEGALDDMLALRGVTFEWQEPEEHGNMTDIQMGMVAQEVEEVFPSWVGEDRDGYKDLTFRGFEALTTEAVRELNNKIDALEAENEEMRRIVEEIRIEMEGMKALLGVARARFDKEAGR
ncbi:tail fiber domain-containing protein [Thermodesulfobacteriota bacterium]